jgi:Neuraminidase (sialidase)
MRVIDETIVHRNRHPSYTPESYSATTVAWTRVGSAEPYLLAAFRLGSARMSPDGRIVLHASRDGGRTWSAVPSPLAGDAARTVGAEPGRGPNLAGSQMGSSDDGTTILMAARMRMTEPGAPDWDDQAAGMVDADSVVVRAGPGGGWDAPVIVEGRHDAQGWSIPCGSPLALGAGRWLLPLERHARTTVPEWLRGYEAFTAWSEDDGRTWGRLTDALNDPERRVAYYDQRMVLLANGRVLSLAWVHDVIEDRTLHARAGSSADGGLTWSEPWETTLMGGPVNPVVLEDGRVVAMYPRRTAPTGVRASISEDGGRTWRTDEEIVVWDERVRRVTGEPSGGADVVARDAALWDAMWGWTFGQPMPVRLGPARVGVCFFATDPSGAPAVRFVTLEV